MSIGSINQFSTSNSPSFNAQALANAQSIAAHMVDRKSTQLINRTAINDPNHFASMAASASAPTSIGNKVVPHAPGRGGRSRINPFDDTPDVDYDASSIHENDGKPRLPYNPNPFFAATEVSAQKSAGPALLYLHQLKKTRQLNYSAGQKRPLIFGTHFSPGQHAREMLRCLALMVEPIRASASY
jgi:hypothetical protein